MEDVLLVQYIRSTLALDALSALSKEQENRQTRILLLLVVMNQFRLLEIIFKSNTDRISFSDIVLTNAAQDFFPISSDFIQCLLR